MPEEIAVKEVKAFIEYHMDEEIDEAQVSKDYWDVVKAVMRGLLNLDNIESPILTLKQPIKTEDGSIDTGSITFLTRIPASKQAAIAKGLDLNKDTLTYINRVTTYLTQLPVVAMLDKIGKVDMKVINHIIPLFQ